MNGCLYHNYLNHKILVFKSVQVLGNNHVDKDDEISLYQWNLQPFLTLNKGFIVPSYIPVNPDLTGHLFFVGYSSKVTLLIWLNFIGIWCDKVSMETKRMTLAGFVDF